MLASTCPARLRNRLAFADDKRMSETLAATRQHAVTGFIETYPGTNCRSGGMWRNQPANTVSAIAMTRPLAAEGAVRATRLVPLAFTTCEDLDLLPFYADPSHNI